MGECIIASGRTSYIESGGGLIATNLPVLNENYPLDTKIKYGTNYTFSTIIDMYPSGCTYQWYCDDQPIDNATLSTYEFISTDTYSTHIIYCIVSNSLGSVITRKAQLINYPSRLYLIQDGIINKEIINNFTGNLSGYEGYGDYIVSTSKTELQTCQSDSNIPLSIYNTLNIRYLLDSNCYTGRFICGAGSNSTSSDYAVTLFSEYNNDVNTASTSIPNNTSDGLLYLALASASGSYASMYIGYIYLE